MPEQLKFGKLPPKHDHRTLKLGAYLKPELPPPPAKLDLGRAVTSWPMYLNDKYGDCTCAAAGHMIETWTANTGLVVEPSDAAVLAFYAKFTTPGPNNGCAMLDVLRGWRAFGLGPDKITAFAQLTKRDDMQMKHAVNLFGGCYIGVVLPYFAVQTDDLLKPMWTLKPYGLRHDGLPDEEAGHCVNAVAYDEKYLYVVTWGAVKKMSWGFYRAYCDESYAVISPDWLRPHGNSPLGFDVGKLMEDLGALGRVSGEIQPKRVA